MCISRCSIVGTGEPFFSKLDLHKLIKNSNSSIKLRTMTFLLLCGRSEGRRLYVFVLRLSVFLPTDLEDIAIMMSVCLSPSQLHSPLCQPERETASSHIGSRISQRVLLRSHKQRCWRSAQEMGRRGQYDKRQMETPRLSGQGS